MQLWGYMGCTGLLRGKLTWQVLPRPISSARMPFQPWACKESSQASPFAPQRLGSALICWVTAAWLLCNAESWSMAKAYERP